MSFQEFTLGNNDESIGVDAPRKFKVEEGHEYVLSFAWWPEDDDGNPDFSDAPRFVGARRIFVDNVGAVLYQGPEYQKFSSGGDEPRMYVGTVVIQWPLTDKGTVDMEKVKAKKWQVMPLIISEGKYKKIRSQHNRFPLGENDLHVACPKGGTQYQQMDFQPNPKSVFAALMKTKASKLLKEQIEACVPKVKAEIGREMTIAQIRDKLGEEGGAQPVEINDTDLDIDDQIDGIIDDED